MIFAHACAQCKYLPNTKGFGSQREGMLKEMDETTRKIPAHEIVYRQIREMILFGDLAPAQPVTIQGLAEALSVGMTPIREALRRLTAEGALLPMGNRRICVPELTLKDLEQLAFLRLHVEPELARQAAESIDSHGIHTLRAIDNNLNAAIDAGDVGGYLRHNHAFHMHLYGYAQAPILLAAAEALWLRAGPSLRVVCGRHGTANLPDKHDEALDALADRAPDTVCAAIRQDIHQGLEQIRQTLGAEI